MLLHAYFTTVLRPSCSNSFSNSTGGLTLEMVTLSHILNQTRLLFAFVLQVRFHIHASFSRTHTGKQTWWLWWCTSPAELVSPARSSPPLPPAWQGPARGSPASADLSHGLNAGLWSGAGLVSLPAGRSEACHPLGVMPRPWTWRGEPTGWTRLPGNGRRRSSGSENMPCCPQHRGYVHNAWKKKWKLRKM